MIDPCLFCLKFAHDNIFEPVCVNISLQNECFFWMPCQPSLDWPLVVKGGWGKICLKPVILDLVEQRSQWNFIFSSAKFQQTRQMMSVHIFKIIFWILLTVCSTNSWFEFSLSGLLEKWLARLLHLSTMFIWNLFAPSEATITNNCHSLLCPLRMKAQRNLRLVRMFQK